MTSLRALPKNYNVDLFQTNLQTSFSSFTDRLGEQIFFLLQRHMNYPTLGRIQNTERKRNAVLPNVTRGELRHRMKLSFPRLPKTVRIDNESMLTIKIATQSLKQQYLERVEQLAVLRECEMSILTTQIDDASLVGPTRRNGKIESHPVHNLGQKLLRIFAGLVHKL